VRRRSDYQVLVIVNVRVEGGGYHTSPYNIPTVFTDVGYVVGETRHLAKQPVEIRT
jgi:hypothetical protein